MPRQPPKAASAADKRLALVAQPPEAPGASRPSPGASLVPAKGEPSAVPSAASHGLRQVLTLLSHGVLGPGSQLPAERELSLQLGVSRSSIREAIAAMVALGLVEARHGAGVFVTALDPAQLLSSLGLTLAVAPLRTRIESAELARTLEPTAIGLAAARADAATLAELDVLASAVADATELADWVKAENAFHRACAAASGNETIAALLDATWSAGSVSAAAPDLVARSAGDHHRTLSALRDRDPERARAAASAHVLLDVLATAELAAAASMPAPQAPHLAAAGRPVPSWWSDAKLGVFIHWGLYSVPGWAPLDDSLVELLTDEETSPRADEDIDPISRHSFSEWYENGVAIPGSPTWRHHQEVYGESPYRAFRPAFQRAVKAFDPQQWASAFAGAGARYAVMVTKHHDGFLLWPSEHPNPAVASWATERDVVGDLGGALRQRGLRMGVYYSSGIDWTFGSLPISRMQDVPLATPAGSEYAEYVDAHWRELIARYSPDILWNDMGYPDGGDVEGLFREFYAAQPDGVVTDRFGTVSYDVATPNYARRHEIAERPWESVRPLGMSFGWNRQESEAETLSGRELVHMLLDVVSKNGNLLLGVSPDDNGEIPAVQRKSLADLGDWLDRNGRSVYATRPWVVSETTTAQGIQVRFTTADDTLFVHLLSQHDDSCSVLGLSVADGATASHVADGSPVSVVPVTGGVRLTGLATDPSATVVAITPAAAARFETWRAPGLLR